MDTSIPLAHGTLEAAALLKTGVHSLDLAEFGDRSIVDTNSAEDFAEHAEIGVGAFLVSEACFKGILRRGDIGLDDLAYSLREGHLP